MTTLAQQVEMLAKRALSPEEVKMLVEYQRLYSIDDEDPLNVVLAIMVRSQLLLDSAPDLLQQKVNETIELHRMALRDQAVLIAKDLIANLAAEMQAQSKTGLQAWKHYLGFFAGGMAFMAIVLLVVQRFMH